MSGKIIHFKSATKKAGCAKKETQAAENRKKFGRTKAEKRADNFEKSKAKTHLDALKLDDE